MSLMGEFMHTWEQGAYGKYLYLPLSFTVNLRLLLKRKSLRKKNRVLCLDDRKGSQPDWECENGPIISALKMEGAMWEEMWASGRWWWQPQAISQQGSMDLRPTMYNLELGSANKLNKLKSRFFPWSCRWEPSPVDTGNVRFWPGSPGQPSPISDL